MYEKSLEKTLKKISLDTLSQTIINCESIANLFFKIHLCTSVRHQVGNCQFEDYNKTKGHNCDDEFIKIDFKLSPSFLNKTISSNYTLHYINWCLEVPKPENFSPKIVDAVELLKHVNVILPVNDKFPRAELDDINEKILSVLNA